MLSPVILTYSQTGAAEDPILVEALVSGLITRISSPFKVLATPLQLNWEGDKGLTS